MKNVWMILSTSIILVNCGVKGKPLPPLSPPDIGRGEPSFSKTTQKIKVKKKGLTKKSAENDWSDSDESEEKELEKKTAP